MSDHKSWKRRQLLLLGAAGCIAVWTAATIGPKLESPPEALPLASEAAENTALAADSAALSERNALRSRLSQLEQKLSQLTAAVPSASATSSPEAPAAPPPSASEVMRSEHKQRALVVQRLAEEPIDPAWQPATEAKIAQALKASPEPDAIVLGTSCRSSHCSVQLNLEAMAPDDRPLAINRMLAALPWEAQAFYQPSNADDTALGAMYITREGHQTFASAK